ncbi:uncharacterized protein LAESUDRAFT_617064, partial [Laetiporus sulphureus 93-53]
WTSETQNIWLEHRRAAFLNAQEIKTTSAFMLSTSEAWFSEFGVDPPTAKELQQVNGSKEAANVIVTEKTKKHLRWWFDNHTHITSSGSGSKKVLDLTKGHKQRLHAYQAYYKL